MTARVGRASYLLEVYDWNGLKLRPQRLTFLGLKEVPKYSDFCDLVFKLVKTSNMGRVQIQVPGEFLLKNEKDLEVLPQKVSQCSLKVFSLTCQIFEEKSVLFSLIRNR